MMMSHVKGITNGYPLKLVVRFRLHLHHLVILVWCEHGTAVASLFASKLVDARNGRFCIGLGFSASPVLVVVRQLPFCALRFQSNFPYFFIRRTYWTGDRTC
jgi:hypothetical protein